jgi:Bacterial Ig domain
VAPGLLRAEITPVDDVTTVTFFVDGTRVCSVARSPYECNWDAGSHVVEHDVRVVVSLKAGGRLVRSVRTKSVTYAEHVDVDAVQVTATVSKDGRFVSDLPVTVFRVFEDGKPQRITGFADSRVPLDLVVAVDISGSMEAAIPALKATVREFLAAVPDKDTVTLLGFNDNIFTIARKATAPAERVAGLDNLAAWGATALLRCGGQGHRAAGHRFGPEGHRRLHGRRGPGQSRVIRRGPGASPRERRSDLHDRSGPGGHAGGTGQGAAAARRPNRRPRGAHGPGRGASEGIQAAAGRDLESVPPGERRPGTWHAIKVHVDGYSQIRARQGYMIRAE